MDRPQQQDIYGASARTDVLPHVPRDVSSVLDVGCGRGGFGTALREVLGRELRLVGVEPVPSQAAAAREDSFDEVYDGYFPDDLPGDETFDLITFNDVLEHIVDPWETLRQCHGRLTLDGRVLAAIPSIQYFPVVWQLLRGRWDYADSGTLDRTHVRFFTRATMIQMFEDTGYQVEKCVGVNGHEVLWSTDPVAPRRWLKLALAKSMRDFNYLHFLVVARSVKSA